MVRAGLRGGVAEGAVGGRRGEPRRPEVQGDGYTPPATARPGVTLTGERRLALAVMQDAVEIVLRRRVGRVNIDTYRETVAWFASDDRTWPYAFVNLCDQLGLEVEAIRARLKGEPAP